LVFMNHPTSYPVGGVVGAILGQTLFQYFAMIGALILALSFVLISLAVTADGVLAGLGYQGMSVFQRGVIQLQSGLALMKERQQRLIERRAERSAAKKKKGDRGNSWSFGQEFPGEEATDFGALKEEKVARAKAQGRAWADKQADREDAKQAKKVEQNLPSKIPLVGTEIDLTQEEGFELGVLADKSESLMDSPVIKESGDVQSVSLAMVPVIQDERSLVPAEVGSGRVKNLLTKQAPKQQEFPNEPQIVDVRPKVDLDEIEKVAAETEVNAQGKWWKKRTDFPLPPATLLEVPEVVSESIDPEKLKNMAMKLTNTLLDYGIHGVVREIRPGPVVTMFEYVPQAGTKVSKISALADDLAMVMEALRVRIVAPIPGKGAVGIEIPNATRETVFLKELVTCKGFRETKTKLPVVLGKNIEGKPRVADLSKMPHLLVAGATGSGKSVFVNSLIMSILFKARPDEVRFIMIDPKMLELSVYNEIPHLLLPVVTDPKKAALALKWGVNEMERRYQLMSDVSVRNIDGYNSKIEQAAKVGEEIKAKEPGGSEEIVCEVFPYIVIIVDELADLMMTAGREVEGYIMRLAQKARAAGIHLILATQRPSVDVLTGVIKANFPTRIAFQVASRTDSRTILDSNGAENLLGSGDMLYLSTGIGGLERVHGAFVKDDEILKTAEFLKEHGEPDYDESILTVEEVAEETDGEDKYQDELYDRGIAIAAKARKVSISMIQRHLQIGYNRAARMVERMEQDQIVGPPNGAKPREVLIPPPVEA